MKSVLEEIYYSNEGLVEKIREKDSEEYRKIHSEYNKVYEQLLKGLNNEQKNLLDDLFMLSGGLESETGLTHFKEGFKFCMSLIFEGIGK